MRCPLAHIVGEGGPKGRERVHDAEDTLSPAPLPQAGEGNVVSTPQSRSRIQNHLTHTTVSTALSGAGQ